MKKSKMVKDSIQWLVEYFHNNKITIYPSCKVFYNTTWSISEDDWQYTLHLINADKRKKSYES